MILDGRRRPTIDIGRNGGQFLLLVVCTCHEKDVEYWFRGEEGGLFIVTPGDCDVRVWFPDCVANWGVWIDESVGRGWEERCEEGRCEGEKEEGLHVNCWCWVIDDNV